MSNGDGGEAFPHEHYKGCLHCAHGMSLRDYLACHIMETLITPGLAPNIETAQRAYEWAGFMLQARSTLGE